MKSLRLRNEIQKDFRKWKPKSERKLETMKSGNYEDQEENEIGKGLERDRKISGIQKMQIICRSSKKLYKHI